jgi:hypothetical protein
LLPSLPIVTAVGAVLIVTDVLCRCCCRCLLCCRSLLGRAAAAEYGIGATPSSCPWLSDLMVDIVGSRVVEACLRTGSQAVYSAIFESVLPRLAKAVENKVSNFVVQSLLAAATSPSHKQQLVEGLIGSLPVIFERVCYLRRCCCS